MILNHQNSVFVTGTDTGVGKTYVSALIVEQMRKAGADAVGLKPVCSGERDDAERLWQAAGGTVDIDTINPYWYKTPIAPLPAGRIERRALNLDEMVANIARVRAEVDFTLVEGAGGWEVPLGEGFGIPEFAKALEMPILIVADNRLGAINHTLLTVKAIHAAGLPCLGIILNHLEAERNVAAVTNKAMLDELSPVPVVAEVLTDGGQIDWL